MTSKEYADAFEFKTLKPDQCGCYHLPMEFIRCMVSLAYMDGKIDGVRESYDERTMTQRKETADVISQS